MINKIAKLPFERTNEEYLKEMSRKGENFTSIKFFAMKTDRKITDDEIISAMFKYSPNPERLSKI